MRVSPWILISLISCQSLWAQEATPDRPPAGVPQLVAQAEDRALPLEIESLDAEVRLHGFLAQTTLVVTFFNPDPRTLEGEFSLYLPEGATVSGYGLDVDGVLVDGVVVEKERARIIFEREARQQIDPGLVEWQGGGLFRTRVYPILGESRRTVKIEYLSELDFQRRQGVYRLPLTAYPRMARMTLNVIAEGYRNKPKILRHPFSTLARRSAADRFLAEADETDFEPTEDLEIRLRIDRRVVMIEDLGDGTHAFAVADYTQQRASRRSKAKGPSPRRLAIFWDASYSRRLVDHEASRRVVAALLKAWRPSEVALWVFRDQLENSGRFTVDEGRSPDLQETLAKLTYDGATSWQDVAIPEGFQADVALVFSDGRINLGDRQVPELNVPSFVFGSAGDDRQVLRHLAYGTGGNYFDITAATDDIVGGVQSIPTKLQGVVVEQGKVREVQAPIGRPVAGPTIFTGLLDSPRARLKFTYALAQGRTLEVPLSLRAKPGSADGLVSRLWAQQKLARLVLEPTKNHQAIRDLGREHGLVTPGTSLLVLETLEQYVQYRVEPPETLTEMRAEYQELVVDLKDEAAEELADYRDQLSHDWQSYLEWSRRSFDFPPPGSIKERPRRPSRTNHSPPPATTPPPPTRNADAARDPFADRPAAAQTLRGVVTDTENWPLPGVTIELYSDALVSSIYIITDENGAYQTRPLAPGQYEISAELEGFSSVAQDVRVERGAALRLDLQLSASIEETITVTSAVETTAVTVDETDIQLKPWTPDTPYLDLLRAAPDTEVYGVYLEQRQIYGDSPAFYVDVSRELLRRGLTNEGLRVASTLLELEVEEPRLILAAADLFLQAEAWERAVWLLEHRARLRPELPQSKRDLALTLILWADELRSTDPTAAHDSYSRAASLLHQLALEPWGEVPSELQMAYLSDGRFDEIGRIALVEHGWAQAKMRALSAVETREPQSLDPEWTHLPDADLRIVLTWDDEFADMDLWVIEPSGEKVYYRNPKSTIGGLLSEDCTNGLGPESYVVHRAMPGTYRIKVNYFSDSGAELLGPVTVQTLIVSNFGRRNERIERQSVRLETSKETLEIGTFTVEP